MVTLRALFLVHSIKKAQPSYAFGLTHTAVSRRTPLALTFGAAMSIATLSGGPLTKTSCNEAALPASAIVNGVSLLNSGDAAQIDIDLMSPEGGFSIEQLMELAGLSCAEALATAYPLSQGSRVLVVCGPGNNGGDGLVAARHLAHFGYSVTLLYPKQPSGRPLFAGLVTQCKALGIPVKSSLAELGPLEAFDVAMDAVFGFSFAGDVRPPFGAVLSALKDADLPLVSVDVPSGWDVDRGDTTGAGLRPDVLVSLTAPKLCAASFSGRHYLGGRFVPAAITAKYQLQLPAYPRGPAQLVELRGWGAQSEDLFEGSVAAPGQGEEVAVVWVTAPAVESRALARAIVAAKVAACVNIVPSVASVYEWKGQVEEADEDMLMVKTTFKLLPALTALVKEKHSYEVPETIAVAIVGGNRRYLQWVRESTQQQPPPAKR
jgi:NAD(P)H-hydrate epimerase